MKISIIVPVYNAEKYIDKLVNSVINQRYSNYELILVDDESTDNSLEIIKKWEKVNSKIKAYTKKNTGPGFTRKFGFEKSSGDLLFFVDSDDWITDEMVLEKINNIFSNNEIDVLFFDREDIYDNKNDIVLGFNKIKSGYHKIDEMNDLVRPGLGAKILKKDILTSDMFIESNIYEDLYTTYLYLDKCNNFYYIDETFYTIYHEKNSMSLSTVKNDSDLETYKKSLDIVLDIYDNLDTESLKYSLSLRMVSLFNNYIRKYRKLTETNLNQKINKMVKILKENKIPYVSIYSKNKMIKKMGYSLFLNIRYRRCKNDT